MKAIVAYIPVLHEGYRKFFEKHSDADCLYILDKSITENYRPLVKDIRALDPLLIKKSIESWNFFKKIQTAGVKELEMLSKSTNTVVMPDEDVTKDLALKYFSGDKPKIIFDKIFLRWDAHKSFENQRIEVDQTISTDSKDNEMIEALRKEADKSSDIWRQIGAAIVKDGKIISLIHNSAVPSEHLPYVEGDPRSNFKKGINIELSTSFHCEARLVAEAASKGINLTGTSLYVTTFPCPPCAKIVAYSGIKKLYYADGYGVLDGERVLKSQGVEIIFVKKS